MRSGNGSSQVNALCPLCEGSQNRQTSAPGGLRTDCLNPSKGCAKLIRSGIIEIPALEQYGENAPKTRKPTRPQLCLGPQIKYTTNLTKVIFLVCYVLVLSER